MLHNSTGSFQLISYLQLYPIHNLHMYISILNIFYANINRTNQIDFHRQIPIF